MNGKSGDIVHVSITGLGWWDNLIAPGETAVVEALCEENEVGDGVIYREDDLGQKVSSIRNQLACGMITYHRGENILQDSAQDVEDISEQPDNEKL